MARRIALALAAGALLLGLLAPTPASAEIDPVNGWDYRPAAVGGAYRAVSGQFAGDFATDILFYAPGSAPDSLWIGRAGQRGQEAFTKVPLAIGGDYQPIVGDFGGDDYDDIVWYGPGTQPDYLWLSVDSSAYFDKSRRVSVGGSYQPKVLRDYRAAGAKDDILFLGPGALPDYYWHFTDRAGTAGYLGPGTYGSRPLTVNGAYQLVVGDFSGDRIEDVILYQPGTAFDYKWIFNAAGQQSQTPLKVDGTYQPVVSYQPRYDGVFWWGNGGPNAYWVGDGRNFGSRSIANNVQGPGTARAFGLGSAVITSPAGQDLQFYGDASAGGFYQLATASHDQTTATPILGNYDDDASNYLDVLWYGPGTQPDELWYGIQIQRAATNGAGPGSSFGTMKDLGVPER